jgi:hypothetical protein
MYTARVPVEKKEEEEDKNTEKKFLGSHFHNWRL